MVSRAAAGPRCSSSGCAGGPRRARWRQSTCGKMASLAHRFDSFAFFLVEHHAPERDGVTGAEGRLDFVRIAPVRPEEDEPVEDGLDVGHLIRPALREDAQQATVLLFKKKKEPKKHWDHTILAFSTRRNWIRIRTKSNGIKAQGLDGFQNRRLLSISKPPSQKVHHQRVRPGRGAYLPPLRCMAGT